MVRTVDSISLDLAASYESVRRYVCECRVMLSVALCTATGGGRGTQAEEGRPKGAKVEGPVHLSPSEGRASITLDCEPNMSE